MKDNHQNIHIEIDELIFHGFKYSDALKIADAFEIELAKEFQENSLNFFTMSTSVANHPTNEYDIKLVTIDGGEFNLSRGMYPDIAGGRLATYIFHQLKPAISNGEISTNIKK